jgi:hypothetical protein
MVLLVLHDKQFDLVKTPIKFTDELLNRQISNWKTLETEKQDELYSSFMALYDDTSLITQQIEEVRITDYS